MLPGLTCNVISRLGAIGEASVVGRLELTDAPDVDTAVRGALHADEVKLLNSQVRRAFPGTVVEADQTVAVSARQRGETTTSFVLAATILRRRRLP